ncbi:hypothetical protein DFH29DRAFT_957141 [Suillus ampliporus]|nr:hypothetical protein DFH29DRAFT_957141 [Suillus ampliporus]
MLAQNRLTMFKLPPMCPFQLLLRLTFTLIFSLSLASLSATLGLYSTCHTLANRLLCFHDTLSQGVRSTGLVLHFLT